MNDLFASLAHLPAVQGALVAVSAVLTEDPTTIASGLLVAGGQMRFLTAFLGLALGIAAGDMGLFALGRLAGPRVRASGLVAPERLERAARWFDRYGVALLLAARCVPGSRLPTYVAAGALKVRWPVFVATALLGASAWALVLLLGIRHLGEAILPYVGNTQWVFALTLGFLLLNVVLFGRAKRRRRRQGDLQAVAAEA